MHKCAKIYVAGHRGMAGSAIVRKLSQLGYENIMVRTRQELDLCDQAAVARFFIEEKPEFVFMAAAKVGGIHANNHYPADFIRDNLIIQHNIIESSYQNQVKRLLFLGSSCIYPKNCPQPIKESYLMTSELEPTNRPYAVAKIAGIEQCWSYNRQFGTRYLAAMPTNLFGPGDNYHLENSHVMAALIRRIHEAKMSGLDAITAWGTGKPRREFLHVDELADACVFLMNQDDIVWDQILNNKEAPVVNVGSGVDISIAELIAVISSVIGYEGQIHWDQTKPDGTMQKLLDVSKMAAIGWESKIDFKQAIQNAYDAFVNKEIKECSYV